MELELFAQTIKKGQADINNDAMRGVGVCVGGEGCGHPECSLGPNSRKMRTPRSSTWAK